MKNEVKASLTSLGELTEKLIDQLEALKKSDCLAKKVIMSRFGNNMLSTEWCKIIGVKPNFVCEFLMKQGLLQKHKSGKGWLPTEEGEEYFIRNSQISSYTPVLRKKGAIYLLNMACEGKLPLAK